jgi:hypothetical protein
MRHKPAACIGTNAYWAYLNHDPQAISQIIAERVAISSSHHR